MPANYLDRARAGRQPPNTSSPNRDGTCGHDVVFSGSDQMLMRRAGATPSQRLKFAFQTVPATGGRRDSSSKFPHGIEASNVQPVSVSVR